MAYRLYGCFETKADMDRVPAIPNNEGEVNLLLGENTIGDRPPSIWHYDSTSSATHDFNNGVYKPASIVGNGRWLFISYYWANANWNASSGMPNILNKPIISAIPGLSKYVGYGTGTAYNLTTTPAKITFGTTSPTITITVAGVYLIIANVTIDYSGLSTVAVAACNFKIRRTNNTAADLANASTNFNIPIVTLLTQTGGDADVPAVFYTTANANDVLELWGNRGAVAIGNIQVSNAYIMALKISD